MNKIAQIEQLNKEYGRMIEKRAFVFLAPLLPYAGTLAWSAATFLTPIIMSHFRELYSKTTDLKNSFDSINTSLALYLNNYRNDPSVKPHVNSITDAIGKIQMVLNDFNKMSRGEFKNIEDIQKHMEDVEAAFYKVSEINGILDSLQGFWSGSFLSGISSYSPIPLTTVSELQGYLKHIPGQISIYKNHVSSVIKQIAAEASKKQQEEANKPSKNKEDQVKAPEQQVSEVKNKPQITNNKFKQEDKGQSFSLQDEEDKDEDISNLTFAT